MRLIFIRLNANKQREDLIIEMFVLLEEYILK